MTIANELRASIAHILERYTDRPFDSIAPIRVAHVKAMGEYIESAEEAKAHCTCAPVRGFEIDTSRTDAAPYVAMEQARVDRLLFDGAA